MSRIDSGFDRLADAWKMNFHLPQGRLRKPWRITGDSMFGGDGPRSRPAPGLRCERATALHTTQVATVTVALAPDGICAPLAGGATAVSSRRDRLYKIGAILPSDSDDLDRLLREQAPRVLLLDVRLIEEFGVDAVRRLRRRHCTTGDWLLGWDRPHSRGFELAIHCQARGCVEWSMSTEQLVEALDAVLAGELWFPRRIMQSLYLSLLEAARVDAQPGEVSVPCGAQSLTLREAEVLTLMRGGLTNKQIGQRLGISINTVKKHLEHAFEKRGLRGRRQAIA